MALNSGWLVADRRWAGKMAAVTALTVTVVIALAMVPSVARAASPAPAREYRDYLSDVQFQASGADQCSKPVSARRGNWMCVDKTSTSRTGIVPADDESGFCMATVGNGGGVWQRYSTVDADSCQSGVYGFGETVLGDVQLYFEVVLNGGQARSKPVMFKSTGFVSTLEIEGDRLYLSKAHPEGKPIGGAYAFYTAGPIPANDVVQWLPNGYKSYENTDKHGSVVHEWVWTNAEYPGNWFLFSKSIVFHRQSSGAYFFDENNTVPKNPIGFGWHAS